MARLRFSLFALFLLQAGLFSSPAAAGDEEPLSSSYVGFGFELGVATPIGDSRFTAASGEEFAPIWTFGVWLPVDITEYGQLYAIGRLGGGGVDGEVFAQSTTAVDDELRSEFDEATGHFIQVGVGARLFPYRLGKFRPFVSIEYDFLTTMGVRRFQSNVRGETACTDACVDFSAGEERANWYYTGSTLAPALGLRYDLIQAENVLISFFGQWGYAINWWTDSKGRILSKDLPVTDVQAMSLNHMTWALSIAGLL